MPKTEVYQLRLTKEEKTELAGLAGLNGGSIAKLIRDTFGLGDRIRRHASPPYESKPAPTIKTDRRETAEASLPHLITQLKGQGMTTPVATREARKRLGL